MSTSLSGLLPKAARWIRDWHPPATAEFWSDLLSTAWADVVTCSRGVTSPELVEDIESRLGVDLLESAPATLAGPV